MCRSNRENREHTLLKQRETCVFNINQLSRYHKFPSVSENQFFLLLDDFLLKAESNVDVKDKMDASVEKTGSEKKRVAICTDETES